MANPRVQATERQTQIDAITYVCSFVDFCKSFAGVYGHERRNNPSLPTLFAAVSL